MVGGVKKMPTGKPVSEEKKVIMRRLRKQGLNPYQISRQLGLKEDAVRRHWHCGEGIQ